jgi:hypothetical protein
MSPCVRTIPQEPNGGQTLCDIKYALNVLWEAIVCHDNFEPHWDKFGDIKRSIAGHWHWGSFCFFDPAALLL